MNKKREKRGLIIARVPCGCDVACKATWQSHAGPRSAYVAHVHIYLFILYIIRGIQPPVYREGIRILLSVELYKPDGFV